MDLFFSNQIYDDKIILSEAESIHCLKALRKRLNDSIFITNGIGKIFKASIYKIENNIVICNNITLHFTDKLKKNISIGISIIKNKNRLEWFLEKATEIGVNNIYPIICNKTEKKLVNKKRGENIIMSAMKQSNNCILPILHNPITFNEVFNINIQLGVIAHCHNLPKLKLHDLRNKKENAKEIMILIGP